jgi:hypothetical protein
VWCEYWLVLAAQDARNFCTETTKNEAFGINNVPGALDLACFW